jgi:hypothetical protein
VTQPKLLFAPYQRVIKGRRFRLELHYKWMQNVTTRGTQLHIQRIRVGVWGLEDPAAAWAAAECYQDMLEIWWGYGIKLTDMTGYERHLGPNRKKRPTKAEKESAAKAKAEEAAKQAAAAAYMNDFYILIGATK